MRGRKRITKGHALTECMSILPWLRSRSAGGVVGKSGQRRADHRHPKGVRWGGGDGELYRRHGIAKACSYPWKSKFGGLELSEARWLRQLEEGSRQLKRIVAEQAVDIRALKTAVARTESDSKSECDNARYRC